MVGWIEVSLRQGLTGRLAAQTLLHHAHALIDTEAEHFGRKAPPPPPPHWMEPCLQLVTVTMETGNQYILKCT